MWRFWRLHCCLWSCVLVTHASQLSFYSFKWVTQGKVQVSVNSIVHGSTEQKLVFVSTGPVLSTTNLMPCNPVLPIVPCCHTSLLGFGSPSGHVLVPWIIYFHLHKLTYAQLHNNENQNSKLHLICQLLFMISKYFLVGFIKYRNTMWMNLTSSFLICIVFLSLVLFFFV